MSICTILTFCLVALSRAFTPNLHRCERLPKWIGNRTSNRCNMGFPFNRKRPRVPSRDIVTRPLMLHVATRRNALAMTQNEEHDVTDELDQQEINVRPQVTKLVSFFDAILEIPDTRLFAGDILFLLIVNFLLNIADELGDPNFWMSGGFIQPVTLPTTLLPLVVRDSKMTMSWIFGGLWNRAYSFSSVSDDTTAVKDALKIWVDYCSLRIILELTGSILITHSPVDAWPLAREVWYTAIVMSFFRVAYGRFLSNSF